MRITVWVGSLALALGCATSHGPADHVAEYGSVRGFESAAHMHLFVPAADSCVRLTVAIGPPTDGTVGPLRVESDTGGIGASWYDTSCATVRAAIDGTGEDVGRGERATGGWLRFQAEELSGELTFEHDPAAAITVRIEPQRVLLL